MSDWHFHHFIQITYHAILLDSKSWTPKILNDIVGRKKIQSECSEKDNPLEFLPEKRSKTIRKSASNETDKSTASGNEPSSVDQAIDYLLNDVFHSLKQPVEKLKGDSALDRALNYLFVDEKAD